MSEGFLSRWSRRKRGEAEPVEPPEAVAEAAPPAAEPPPAPPVAEEREPEFDLSQLPPLDSLTAESDFSVFLKPGVPAAIRGAALRKAWVADPLIRDYVSPLDYGWDFNAPGGVPGFALELGETGERLKKLIAQAVGEREEEPPPPQTAAPTEDERTPEAEEPAPPALVAEAAPPPLDSASPPAEEEPAPARRHGGAMPA